MKNLFHSILLMILIAFPHFLSAEDFALVIVFKLDDPKQQNSVSDAARGIVSSLSATTPEVNMFYLSAEGNPAWPKLTANSLTKTFSTLSKEMTSGDTLRVYLFGSPVIEYGNMMLPLASSKIKDSILIDAFKKIKGKHEYYINTDQTMNFGFKFISNNHTIIFGEDPKFANFYAAYSQNGKYKDIPATVLAATKAMKSKYPDSKEPMIVFPDNTMTTFPFNTKLKLSPTPHFFRSQNSNNVDFMYDTPPSTKSCDEYKRLYSLVHKDTPKDVEGITETITITVKDESALTIHVDQILCLCTLKNIPDFFGKFLNFEMLLPDGTIRNLTNLNTDASMLPGLEKHTIIRYSKKTPLYISNPLSLKSGILLNERYQIRFLEIIVINQKGSKENPFHFNIQNTDRTFVKQTGATETYKVSLENIPALDIPLNNEPSLHKTMLFMNFSLTPSWEDVAAIFEQEFGKEKENISPLLAEISQKALAGAKDEQEKIQRLYNLVSDVRYWDPPHSRSPSPQEPEDMFKNAFGNNKDKTKALCELAKLNNIKAYPALMLLGTLAPDIDENVPANKFNSTGVYFPDHNIWFVPNIEEMSTYASNANITGRKAFVLHGNKKYEIRTITQNPHSENLLENIITLNQDAITVEHNRTGFFHLNANNMNTEDIFMNHLSEILPCTNDFSAEIIDGKNDENKIVFSLKATPENAEKNSACNNISRYVIPFSTKLIFRRLNRPKGFYIHSEQSFSYRTIIKNVDIQKFAPETFETEPVKIEYSNPAPDTIALTVTFKRGLLTPEEYKAVRELFLKLNLI